MFLFVSSTCWGSQVQASVRPCSAWKLDAAEGCEVINLGFKVQFGNLTQQWKIMENHPVECRGRWWIRTGNVPLLCSIPREYMLLFKACFPPPDVAKQSPHKIHMYLSLFSSVLAFVGLKTACSLFLGRLFYAHLFLRFFVFYEVVCHSYVIVFLFLQA